VNGELDAADIFLKSHDRNGSYRRCGICHSVDHKTAEHDNPSIMCGPCFRRECLEALGACENYEECPCMCTIGGR
jgi:hypothetical protein